MEANKNCTFCYQSTSQYHNCIVCKSCKTIMYFSLDSNELFTETKKCIESIQQYLESISDKLYDIESRRINKKELSTEEEQIYNFCDSFQPCRKELLFMVNHHVNPQDKRFRMLLYILLELSADFSNIFHCECHILTI